jgi:transposase
MTIRIEDKNAIYVLQDEIQRSEQARYDHRLHAVLLVAKGITCPAVAEMLGDPERTIRYRVQKYINDGLQGLIENERSGRPSRLEPKHIDKTGKVLRRSPEAVGLRGAIGDGRTLSAYIQNEFGVKLGVRQCQRLFRDLGFRLRKPRSLIARADEEAQKVFKKSPATDGR